jgi:[NiFe] hydrogenase assembly HybE family chaperone
MSRAGFFGLAMTDRTAPVDADAAAIAARVQSAFERVQRERMTGLPFVNQALGVELVGLHRWRGLWLGVLITPWFMNLILLPGDGGGANDDSPPARWPAVRTGDYARFVFPAGVLSFLAGHEGEAGDYLACSLFSPMFEFADHEAARQTAEACLAALFDTAASAEPADEAQDGAAAPAAVSKRDFLRGRWRSPTAATPSSER